MTLAYSDPTPRWVPFVLVAVTAVAVFWGAWHWTSSNVNGASFKGAAIIAGVIGAMMLVAVFCQGWLYWTAQVATLTIAGGRAEATMMRWVGSGRRVAFAANETSNWKAIPKHDDATKLATISFAIASGDVIDLSFLSPKVANLELLATLAPAFFAQVRAQYPALVSVSDPHVTRSRPA